MMRPGDRYALAFGLLATLVFVCFLVALLGGCATTGTRVGEEHLVSFVTGHTTYEETIRTLGRPTHEVRQEDGSRVVTYQYTHEAINPLTYVWIVGMFVSGKTTEYTQTTLSFDPQGRFVTYTQSQGITPFGTGFIAGAKQ